MTTNEFVEQHLDVHYVVMESAPGTWQHYGNEFDTYDFVFDATIAKPIQDAMYRALLTVPDDGECDLCTKPIGYVLHDDDDDPSGNGMRWHWTTAAWYGRHADVLLLCEDCSPHAIRDLFEERARTPEQRDEIDTTDYDRGYFDAQMNFDTGI